jgi:hypothetical protein
VKENICKFIVWISDSLFLALSLSLSLKKITTNAMPLIYLIPNEKSANR